MTSVNRSCSKSRTAARPSTQRLERPTSGNRGCKKLEGPKFLVTRQPKLIEARTNDPLAQLHPLLLATTCGSFGA